jgi:16S rRNA (uracil1498-N3)-methyltransferase
VDAGALGNGRRFSLDAVESAHVAGVLRGRVGDRVRLVDGAGAEADAILAEVSRRSVIAEIETVHRMPQPYGEGVLLALAVVDKQPMDWAVQKAVEVGTRRFVPLLCDRTQHRRRDFSRQVEHWQRVARQALKQCRRSWAMEVASPRLLADFAAERGAGRAVVADPGGRPLSEIQPAAAAALVVGPEGGFAPQELELFDELQWPRLKLAVHVLRAETAAIVGAALLVARDEDLL